MRPWIATPGWRAHKSRPPPLHNIPRRMTGGLALVSELQRISRAVVRAHSQDKAGGLAPLSRLYCHRVVASVRIGALQR